MSDLKPIRSELEARAKAKSKAKSKANLGMAIVLVCVAFVIGGLLWAVWALKAYERSVIRSVLLAPVHSMDEVYEACSKWTGTGLYVLTENDLHIICNVAKAAVVEHPDPTTRGWCGEAITNISAEWKRRGHSVTKCFR